MPASFISVLKVNPDGVIAEILGVLFSKIGFIALEITVVLLLVKSSEPSFILTVNVVVSVVAALICRIE